MRKRIFLGDTPVCDNEIIDLDRFLTPNVCWEIHHNLFVVPPYFTLLDPEDRWGFAEKCPELATVARAQMREVSKQDRALLHANEEVQEALRNMGWKKQLEPFGGEKNINSQTGEARTFTLEDNYPQLEDESESDYKNRLRKIGNKIRLFEKKH